MNAIFYSPLRTFSLNNFFLSATLRTLTAAQALNLKARTGGREILKVAGIVALLFAPHTLVERPVSEKLAPVHEAPISQEKEALSQKLFLEIGPQKSLFPTLEKAGLSQAMMKTINSALPAKIARRVRPGQKIGLTFEKGALVSLKIYVGISRAWVLEPGPKGLWICKSQPIKVNAAYRHFNVHVKDSFKKALLTSGLPKPLIGPIFRSFETSGMGTGNFRGKSIACMYQVLSNEETKEVALNHVCVIQVRGKDRRSATYYGCKMGRRGNQRKFCTLADVYLGGIGGTDARMHLWSRPVGGKVTSGFGMRIHPVLGCKRHHKGVDFSGTYGCPIRAIGAGVVKAVKNHSTYGKHVLISHGSVYQTLYAHLSRSDVRVGQRVLGGQMIGRMGNSGRTTGVHLHLETLKNGKNIDPMCLMGSAKKGGSPRKRVCTLAQKKYLLGQVNFLKTQFLKLGADGSVHPSLRARGKGGAKKNRKPVMVGSVVGKSPRSLNGYLAKKPVNRHFRHKKQRIR